MRSSLLIHTSFIAAAIAAVPAWAGVTADSAVLAGPADGAFGDPGAATGPITGDTTYGGLNPFNPAFDPSQIIKLDPGDTLTLHLSAPVPATGRNLGVFSSVGFVEQNQDGTGQASGSPGTAPATLDQDLSGNNIYWQAVVTVSQDGVNYVALNGGNPIAFGNPSNYYTDTPIYNDYQSLGGQTSDEFKPFLGSIGSFGGENYQQMLATLDGSAGGTWLDLSGTGLTAVNDVRFAVPAGASYAAVVDAVAGSSVIPTITVPSRGSYQFGKNPGTGVDVIYVAGLNVGSGATVTVPLAADHANRSVVDVLAGDGLTIAASGPSPTGKIDLTNNDAVIAVVPPATGSAAETISDLATATAAVAAGYNHGNWNGAAGITSSAAAADTSHLTALGVVQNNQAGGQLFYSFDGTTPGPDDILIKYTYYGDANLDGVVDGSDYSLIDNGYASGGTLTGWYNGDFNYDGVVDGSDYALIDNAFNNQTVNLSTAALVATSTAQPAPATVPEPAAVGAMLLVAAGFGRRRRSWRLFPGVLEPWPTFCSTGVSTVPRDPRHGRDARATKHRHDPMGVALSQGWLMAASGRAVRTSRCSSQA